jgi:hypothetical protein
LGMMDWYGTRAEHQLCPESCVVHRRFRTRKKENMTANEGELQSASKLPDAVQSTDAMLEHVCSGAEQR